MIATIRNYFTNVDRENMENIYASSPWYIQEIIDEIWHYDDTGRGKFFDKDGTRDLERFRYEELNYVRIGLWCEHGRFYGIHKGFGSWKNFCEEALKRTAWQINNYCKAARVTINLINQGFAQLPNCCAQAISLWKLWKKRDPKFFNARPELLGEIWGKIIESCPAHLITARAITEIGGEEAIVPQKSKIAINEKLRDRLVKVASERGMTVEELIAAGVDAIEGKESPEDPDEKTELVSQQKLEAWEADVNALFESDVFVETGMPSDYEQWCEENRIDLIPIGDVDLIDIDSS